MRFLLTVIDANDETSLSKWFHALNSICLHGRFFCFFPVRPADRASHTQARVRRLGFCFILLTKHYINKSHGLFAIRSPAPAVYLIQSVCLMCVRRRRVCRVCVYYKLSAQQNYIQNHHFQAEVSRVDIFIRSILLHLALRGYSTSAWKWAGCLYNLQMYHCFARFFRPHFKIINYHNNNKLTSKILILFRFD